MNYRKNLIKQIQKGKETSRFVEQDSPNLREFDDTILKMYVEGLKENKNPGLIISAIMEVMEVGMSYILKVLKSRAVKTKFR